MCIRDSHNILLTRFRVSHGIRDAGLNWRFATVGPGGTENAGVENAGVEISARSSRKRQGVEMQEWKFRHGNAGGGK